MRAPFVTYIHDYIGNGRFTLAIKVNEGKVNVGVAFCAPKDQFTRKRGRTIAMGRIEKESAYCFSFTRNEDPLKKQAWDMFVYFMENDSMGLVPRWATRSWELGFY